MRKMTRFLRMLLWMKSLFWRQLNGMQLLFFADTWDNDLDLDVSAQLVQAKVQGYLSFGTETEKVKAKARARQIPCSPITFVT